MHEKLCYSLLRLESGQMGEEESAEFRARLRDNPDSKSWEKAVQNIRSDFDAAWTRFAEEAAQTSPSPREKSVTFSIKCIAGLFSVPLQVIPDFAGTACHPDIGPLAGKKKLARESRIWIGQGGIVSAMVDRTQVERTTVLAWDSDLLKFGQVRLLRHGQWSAPLRFEEVLGADYGIIEFAGRIDSVEFSKREKEL